MAEMARKDCELGLMSLLNYLAQVSPGAVNGSIPVRERGYQDVITK